MLNQNQQQETNDNRSMGGRWVVVGSDDNQGNQENLNLNNKQQDSQNEDARNNKLAVKTGAQQFNGGPVSQRTTGDQSQNTIQTQALLLSDSTSSLHKQDQMKATVSVNKVSVYQCSHSNLHTTQRKSSHILCGDAHLVNCNVCGAYYPKSGSSTIRALKRHSELNKLYTSDILRSMYSQCQQRSNRPELHIKITSSYQEVRNLIIDWMAEVAETLRLDI